MIVPRPARMLALAMLASAACSASTAPRGVEPYASRCATNTTARPDEAAVTEAIAQTRAFVRATRPVDARHGDGLARLASLLVDDADRLLDRARNADPRVATMHPPAETPPAPSTGNEVETASNDMPSEEIVAEPIPLRNASEVASMHEAVRRDVVLADARIAEAIGAYRALLRLEHHPLRVGAQEQIATLLDRQGQHRRAAMEWARLLREPIDDGPRERARIALADFAWNAERWRDAAHLYASALDHADPADRASIAFRLAVASARGEDVDRALRALPAAVTRDPGRMAAIASMAARLHAIAYRPAAADAVLHDIETLSPDPVFRADVVTHIARLLVAAGRANEALEISARIDRAHASCAALVAFEAAARSALHPRTVRTFPPIPERCTPP